MAFAVLALFLHSIVKDSPFNMKEFIALLIPLLLLSPAKGAYALFAFLFLLIPSKRFESKRGKAMYFFIMIFICAVFMLAVLIPALNGKFSNVSDIFTSSEFSFFKKCSLIFHSFFYYLGSWFVTCIGFRLSAFNLILPKWIIVSFIVLLLISVVISYKQFNPTISARVLALVISLAIAVSFLVALLITWPQSNDVAISGVQGRYFIPVLPLVLYAVSFGFGDLESKYRMPVFIAWLSLSAVTVCSVVNQTVGALL